MTAPLQLSRSDFRTYLHPPQAIVELAKAHGLSLVHQSFSGFWQIVVFERQPHRGASQSLISNP